MVERRWEFILNNDDQDKTLLLRDKEEIWTEAIGGERFPAYYSGGVAPDTVIIHLDPSEFTGLDVDCSLPKSVMYIIVYMGMKGEEGTHVIRRYMWSRRVLDQTTNKTAEKKAVDYTGRNAPFNDEDMEDQFDYK
jgi:hypothetical protein